MTLLAAWLKTWQRRHVASASNRYLCRLLRATIAQLAARSVTTAWDGRTGVTRKRERYRRPYGRDDKYGRDVIEYAKRHLVTRQQHGNQGMKGVAGVRIADVS